jgi:cobalt/nickel transport system permease protein
MPPILLGVHLSDGVLSTAWTVAGFGGTALLLLLALWGLKEEQIPRIGLLSATFFVGSSIHIKLAVFGSVHLILNGLVGVVLGRRAPLAILVGLLLQSFLLAHGGLTALGMNTCIIAIPAVLAGWTYPLLRAMRLPPFIRGALLGGGAVALTVTLNFLVLLFCGKEDWSTLAKFVLLAHVPIVFVEGLMLGVIVQYLEMVKPDLLRTVATEPQPSGHEFNIGH